MFQLVSRLQIRANPLHLFTYLLMPALFFFFFRASLLNRCLKCSTDSQFCLSIVTCGVSGGKTFSLDKCTKLDICQQCGWLQLLYRGLSIGNSWFGVPFSQVLRRTWSPGFICEIKEQFCSFLCSFTGSQQCLVDIILDRLLNLFSVQFSHPVVSDSLQPHGLQHSRPSCPSPLPGAY